MILLNIEGLRKGVYFYTPPSVGRRNQSPFQCYVTLDRREECFDRTGAVGSGVERNRAMPDVTGSFISLAKSKGLFAGLDLTGSYFEERNKLETEYYGKDITLEDIIVGNSVSNERSAALLESLKRAGG
jgi:hypothetical protein